MDKNGLSSELVDSLRIEILSEGIRPGSKLVEQEVCERFGVSRTPVREALKQLAGEDLVELVHSRGAFVIGFSRGDVADLFELRRDAEAQAVRWAVERFYEKEMEALEEAYEMMVLYAGREDLRKVREADGRFHEAIYEACHSRMLARRLRSYRVYLLNSAHVKRGRKEFLPDMIGEIASVFEAFVNRAPEEAAEAMRRHVERAQARALR
ncbi:MAG: GntR family transcriptional regulator [Clostridiales Family XIII bacterium]|jgi:DNA-binding GntR family transcriptional regulator|nr:GntR family transcriptional regulator [Clostridiales Family XIII bacterium]